jgi:hypothetical protein
MTVEEAVKAAAARVPVLFHDPMQEKPIRYARIAEIRWSYTSRQKIERGVPPKQIFLDLEQDSRAGNAHVIVRPEQVEVEDPEFYEMQAAATAKKPEKEPEEEPEPKKKKAKRKEPFQKPTAEEVAEYAKEAGLSLDVQAFMDHYIACGWVVGKNKPMQDWRAAVRNWVRRKGQFGEAAEGAATEKQSSFETEDFFAAAMRKSYGGIYDGAERDTDGC